MTDPSAQGNSPEDEQTSGLVFRDRRRIDPETGEVRESSPEPAEEPAPAADAASAGEDDEVAKLRAELEERTKDLQRVQAEYVNFRRRVDRDKEALRTETIGKVLNSLLPVLDDLDRAREHGELQGGFKAVADSLEKTTSGLGLERFGTEGEPFDPTVHEALTHEYSPDVEGIMCTRIYQPGYRVGTRVLRAARVAVTEAEGGAMPASVEGALSVDDAAGTAQADGDEASS
ncbi:MAG: nucleotide exchange factor GrpE [Streptosporangiales bacterium]|nr:nucleotide exchange factor GrpE [Streptosporangiales bacterium]